jgi:hypothetical protein
MKKVKRMRKVALFCACTAFLVPLCIDGADMFADQQGEFSSVNVYEWKKMKTDKDLHNMNKPANMLLTWDDYYFSYDNGTYFDGDDMFFVNTRSSANPYISLESDSFYSWTTLSTPTILFKQADTDNADAGMFEIRLPNRQYLNCNYVSQFDLDVDDTYEDLWTIKNTNGSSFQVFNNKSGRDDGALVVQGNIITSSVTESKWAEFQVFYAVDKVLTAIKGTYVVESGVVLRLSDEMLVANGAELIVEEGATLIMEEGDIFLNGKITNKGTVIIGEGCSVYPLIKDGTEDGTIVCEGGDLVMMKDSRCYVPSNTNIPLTFTNGASFVNYGTMLAAKGIIAENSSIDNREGGVIISGCHMVKPSYLPVVPFTNLESPNVSIANVRLNKGSTRVNINLSNGSKFVNDGVVIVKGDEIEAIRSGQGSEFINNAVLND